MTPSRESVTGLLLALSLGLSFSCSRNEPEGGRPWNTFALELTDVSRFPDLSQPGVRLLSSYDRKGGNDDFNYFEKPGSESGWVVIADLKGPGCLWRFWLTGIELGHPFKIYIDGERKPRISGKVEDIFGNTFPFVPPLGAYINRAWYSFVPITFSKSLRIETRSPPTHQRWGLRRLFFHLNVESLPAGSAVQSFPKEFGPADHEAIRQVTNAWYRDVEWPVINVSELKTFEIQPGQEQELFADQGPATLTDWDLDVRPADPAGWSQQDREFLIQDATLRVFYDGLTGASVDVPVGDFFCNGWRARQFGSMALGVSTNGFHCALPMPYQKSVRFVLKNDADRPIAAAFGARRDAGVKPNAGYLHAVWNKSGPQRSGPHSLADFQGRGKYVGCYLGLTSWDNSWWMFEGDEAMFVDGEARPSWHGTGMEDYFNGAWYYRGAAFAALYGVMDMSPYRSGQYRFHLVDPVRFERTFHMEIERGDQNVSQGIMRSVGYAYLEQPSAVRSAGGDRAFRRADVKPLDKETLMFQLFELERMNNFGKAADQVREFLERYPDTEFRGVLELRILEYERLLGRVTDLAAYEPFLRGDHGDAAKQQAQALQWFYAQPNRALVGLNVNGRARLFLDGREVLNGDSPVGLLLTGVELAPGHHTLCADVQLTRDWPWVQFGIRTQDGFAGTGTDTKATLRPPAGWMTGPAPGAGWENVTSYSIAQGPPGLPYIAAIPNAFILLQSKAYGVGALNWMETGGQAAYRVDFEFPLSGWPAHARAVAGLAR